METSKLKRFAQFARRTLEEQVLGKLKLVLAENSEGRREKPDAVTKLEAQIRKHDRGQVVERIAYTWFNRFCALRYMDVNRDNPIKVISSEKGQFQPEILADAKMGHIDKELASERIRGQIFSLLEGNAPSRDPQGEAYRMLVVGACNYWHRSMPFLFEEIDDYTELLMPDDLLSGNSIPAYTREALTPAVCKDIEVIGWLYQFYISEKKDEVFAALKKGRKIAPENIPAATQLFTPRWIVRYLVENSLGRLWMLNRPGSRLKERMDYYIEPEQTETDFLKISSPEAIKICDPACGSGHMLVYAFDLLYAIYEEEGYDPPDIPRLILQQNLYGIEIDERAGTLSAFALVMKARQKYRRFMKNPVQPQICVLENIVFDDGELKPYMEEMGRDLFTVGFQETLHQFEEADNFGALIRPVLTDVEYIRRVLGEKNVGENIFLQGAHEKVLKVLRQTEFLCPRYHVVVANPPYMGGKGMNGGLKAFATKAFPKSKSDLFAMFIERNLDLAMKRGSVAMITMQSWMFLSSFEKLRDRLLKEHTIRSLAHLGSRAFGSIGGEVVSTAAFIIDNSSQPNHMGSYLRAVNCKSENEKRIAILKGVKHRNCGWFFRSSSADFKKIPGNPIAYWMTDVMRELFIHLPALSESMLVTGGMTTADNDRFLRLWYEVSNDRSYRKCISREEAIRSNKKWFPYNKGGTFRKWFGNRDYHVNWFNDGEEIISTGRAFPRSREYYFQESLTYTATGSTAFGVRYSDRGFIFDAKGSSCFASHDILLNGLGFLASKIASYLLQSINPTIEFQTGNLSILPFKMVKASIKDVHKLIAISRYDWDSYEQSWDFKYHPLLNHKNRTKMLKAVYKNLRAHWQQITAETQHLEQQDNRTFIEAYGLQDELTPEVPLSEITLTCNPHYRYNSNKNEGELEALLLAETMREFISYAVGCMFGRYALDEPGLILASQGDTLKDYIRRIPDPTFTPGADNVIPILDGDWFPGDITEKFRNFLRITFGDAHYAENLSFIETAIGKDIRKFFLRDFYTDHIKRYKKRPIYWLFASPKGSFNALIYMHRYRPDTVSIVLNDYLRDFKTKLAARKDHLEQISISAAAGQGEKTKAIKEMEKLKKTIIELEDWEREVLYPLATRRIEIDLDDGVKVNYNKFGAALKKVPGLSLKRYFSRDRRIRR